MATPGLFERARVAVKERQERWQKYTVKVRQRVERVVVKEGQERLSLLKAGKEAEWEDQKVTDKKLTNGIEEFVCLTTKLITFWLKKVKKNNKKSFSRSILTANISILFIYLYINNKPTKQT